MESGSSGKRKVEGPNMPAWEQSVNLGEAVWTEVDVSNTFTDTRFGAKREQLQRFQGL